MRAALFALPAAERADAAFAKAGELADLDVAICDAIGVNGLALIAEIAERKSRVNILTHCNAGWLCAVDWGTATAPIYKAQDAGIDLHVYVDETGRATRAPRSPPGSWSQQGVSHQVIVDNAGGHIMQHGGIDLVIVGTDRTTATGDVCNKIGTYLKALAAKDNDVPFYVAAPSPPSTLRSPTVCGTFQSRSATHGKSPICAAGRMMAGLKRSIVPREAAQLIPHST